MFLEWNISYQCRTVAPCKNTNLLQSSTCVNDHTLWVFVTVETSCLHFIWKITILLKAETLFFLHNANWVCIWGGLIRCTKSADNLMLTSSLLGFKCPLWMCQLQGVTFWIFWVSSPFLNSIEFSCTNWWLKCLYLCEEKHKIQTPGDNSKCENIISAPSAVGCCCDFPLCDIGYSVIW